MAAGSGYNVADINNTLGNLARRAVALKYDATAIRAWFDRISSDPSDATAATALVNAVTGAGGTLTQADALKIVQAMREVTYWAETFAPTVTLDVTGPAVG